MDSIRVLLYSGYTSSGREFRLGKVESLLFFLLPPLLAGLIISWLECGCLKLAGRRPGTEGRFGGGGRV